MYKLICKEKPFAKVTDIDDKSLSQQAAEGLAFVHGEIDGRKISYVHKDVKPSTFVVRRGDGKGQPQWVCKLTDFGNAKETIQGGSRCRTTTRFGTRDWMAPEVLKNVLEDDQPHRFSKKSDVWAMGCLIHFIFTKGQHPYGDQRQRTENIRLGQPTDEGQKALNEINPAVSKLVTNMIQMEPNDRPTMQKVVETIHELI